MLELYSKEQINAALPKESAELAFYGDLEGWETVTHETALDGSTMSLDLGPNRVVVRRKEGRGPILRITRTGWNHEYTYEREQVFLNNRTVTKHIVEYLTPKEM